MQGAGLSLDSDDSPPRLRVAQATMVALRSCNGSKKFKVRGWARFLAARVSGLRKVEMRAMRMKVQEAGPVCWRPKRAQDSSVSHKRLLR